MRRFLSRRLLLAFVCLAAPGGIRASDIDKLVADLAGGDEQARSLARQLLPRHGVEAAPKLLPLLSRQDDTVRQAAFRVLADIANEEAAPGHDADRVRMTDILMTLLGRDQPAAVKVQGLRLLPIVIPAGHDVGPIAALLDDPPLREKAREALEEAGTPGCLAALRRQLDRADPDFRAALLDALGRLRDREGLEAIAKLTGSDNPRVRAAAARALAWSGDPAYFPAARSVVAAADPPTQADATDALIRLIGSVARRGEYRTVAAEAYRDLLARSQGPAKDAALAGLGRTGVAADVPVILDAVRDAELPTVLVAMSALRALKGPDVARAIVEAYQGQSPRLRKALIPVLGSKGDPAALAVLEQVARSDDAGTRAEALEAIGESGLAEGLGVLTMAARQDPGKARAALLRLAGRLAAKGEKNAAGQAYLAAWKVSESADADARRSAIEGLAACPIPDAADAAVAASRDRTLRETAQRALLAVASSLTAAGRKAKALELYDVLAGTSPQMEVVRAMMDGMVEAGSTRDLAGLAGTVSLWWVVGPFDLGEKDQGWETRHIGEPDVSIIGRYMSGKTRVQWKPVRSHDPHGKIDLRASLANRDRCIGYAYAEISLDRPSDAVLLIGADDSEKVWVNGEKVFELFTARSLQPDQDRVPVKLKAGTNTILLKLYQDAQGWEFCLRIVTPDGRPLAFTQKGE
jgi:HEAT repeat protein